jgi:hypothetical protein
VDEKKASENKIQKSYNVVKKMDETNTWRNEKKKVQI